MDIEVIEDESLIDEEELGKFLKRNLPRVLQAVIENETSQAFASNIEILNQFLRFKDYDIMVNLHQSDNTCIYTLFNKENTLVEKDNQLEITDLAWNSTGLTLAAS